MCSSSRAITSDREVYYDLAKKLFGEQNISPHPVPEYMEGEEIPRYSFGITFVQVSWTCCCNTFIKRLKI